MTIKVFLIDDQDIPGKREHFDAFLEYLTEMFPYFSFVNGKMTLKNVEVDHTSLFAADASQINAALHDSSSLVLLDVWMQGAPYVNAARDLLVMNPGRSVRADEISKFLGRGYAGDGATLAGTVMAIAEEALTKIAWVSTKAPGHIGQHLNSSINKVRRISWPPSLEGTDNPKVTPDYWINDLDATQNIQYILETSFMAEAMVKIEDQREIWHRMSDLALKGSWKVHGKNVKGLFGEVGYHSILGHLNDKETLEDNSELLLKATEELMNKGGGRYQCSNARESIAVLKASTRGNSIPIFLFQRIIGEPETNEVIKALYWPTEVGAWDLPSVIIGLGKAIAAQENEAMPATFKLKCHDNEDRATLFITIEGNYAQLCEVESALLLGPAPRFNLPGRTGPGEFTLGIHLLSPTKRDISTENGTQKRIVITKEFDIVKL